MTDGFTLAQARERIDDSLLRALNMGMRLMLGTGVLMAGLLWALNPHMDSYHRIRVVMGLTFSLAALVGLLVARRWGSRAATRFLIATVLLLSLVTAWRTGTGVMSATTALPATMIVLAGFVLGPRAGRITSVCSAAGVGLLWLAQSKGWIPGATSLNAPPPITYGLLLMAAFALLGLIVTRYSQLLWRVIVSLEAHRRDLEDRIAVQDTTQSRLEDSRQRLHALLDHAPMAVIVVDRDTAQMRFANRHALGVHGATDLRELSERCAFDAAPYQFSDMLALVHQARDEGSVTQRWCSRTVLGREIWWQLRLDLLKLSDTPEVVVFGQDITDSLRQEQALLDHKRDLEEQVRQRTSEVQLQQHRLEAVIEALPMSLTIKDKQGRYLLSNRQFEEGFGLSKAMLLGSSPHELFPAALASLFLAHEQELLASPQMVRYENTLLARDGTCRDQLVTKVPLLDARQQPEAVLTVAVDITEQKALQRELAAAKTDAERLAQVKIDFLANMSHEIRTPLHGMLGMAQVAQGTPGLPGEAGHAITRILRSGRHLMGVIDDILDFSRLDAGKMPADHLPYQPAHLAQDVVDLVRDAAHDKGLQLHLVCDPTPELVMGDPRRTRQILVNLMGNAIKFTAEGSVTLHLRSTPDALCFDVIDTGIGMAEDVLQRVFSPFEQADTSTSRRFGGTGLGLGISRHLARLLGGDIGVHSRMGQGSTFTVSLPLTRAEAKDTQDAQPAVGAPAQAAQPAQCEAPLTGLRILAADDVDINREILLSLLCKRGAEVTVAEDGQLAVAQLARSGAGHFDVVLMDIQMPVMDGLEATRRLHELDADLPVLALTAHALPQETERCLAAGMVGHLAKPFDTQDMVAQILKHCRRAAGAGLGALNDAPNDAPPVDLMPPAAGQAPSQPTLELDKALSRCGGQEALLRKLLQKFASQQADFVSRHQGEPPADTEALGRAVHQFKGTAANLGLPALSACAAELESCLRTTPPPGPAQLQSQWQAVQSSLDAHIVAVNAWLHDTVPA
jgi:PAS domain S-box-containing protein